MPKQRKLNENLAKNFVGIWIPKNIWLSQELTPIQMLVLMQIAQLDNDFGCTASNEHIAEFFGVHAMTISEHIQNLQKLNFIKCCYKNGGTDRTINCTRKYKLLTAGLLDEIDDYKTNHKENTEGHKENTEGHKENTEEEITLKKHLISISSQPEISKEESKVQEFQNDIQNNPMYGLTIQEIKKNLIIPKELEKIDEIALRECALSMILANKSSLGSWNGYLKTAYLKAISDFITNSKTTNQIQVNGYYKDKKDNQTIQKSPYQTPINPDKQPASFDQHPQIQTQSTETTKPKLDPTEAKKRLLAGFKLGRDIDNGKVNQQTLNNNRNLALSS